MNLKYFIKNLLASFIGLCALAGIVKVIFLYSSNLYEQALTVLVVMIMILGLMIVGYLNVVTAIGSKIKQPFYLHLILVGFLFVTDLAFGSSSITEVILRNLGYFAVLQLGVYLYMKRSAPKLLLN
ncbi:hypothetical protein GJV03_20535 [Acinetobacter sp. RIT698]|uniref:hypothetical protein n=1 Tax=Acinetobacter TaxID=469 RepID=UPI0002D0BC1F|nr:MULTISPECIES: hypothetical protein [Acinetobacter]ENU59430.1 hypothetical protein F981_01528 [Acinetobacter guillouiae CIP 63.46]KAB0628285.1 hypothetical protein F7P82_06830 [Acinetobacter guillouiae]MDN5479508.1 hypothetical protein [Chryseobacterium sp.]MRT39550.1 hypothetical protein [Acinetobacter sp. RIT698]